MHSRKFGCVATAFSTGIIIIISGEVGQVREPKVQPFGLFFNFYSHVMRIKTAKGMHPIVQVQVREGCSWDKFLFFCKTNKQKLKLVM